MQCYTPLIRVYQEATRQEKDFVKSNDMKLKQRIIPRETVLRQLKRNENYLTGIKRINQENENKGIRWRYQAIPCRHCYACSLNYSAQWATRMACEAMRSKQNYFLTITYSDEFLPIPEKVYYGEAENAYFENDGTWIEGTLVKKDAQDFIKRLREHLRKQDKLGNFKFFLCGEYGGETGRPHYHAIVTDCRLDESQFYDCHVDENHHDVWKSHELDELWSYKDSKRGKGIVKGFVQVAEASWQDMAYVARYTAKKAYKTSDDWEYFSRGKIPEFITMSKNIGDWYYHENKDKIYENDEMIAKTVKNNTSRIKPPKRFDNLLESENPEKYDEIKAKREKISKMLDTMIRQKDNYTDFERLRIQEEKITTKAKQLKRSL